MKTQVAVNIWVDKMVDYEINRRKSYSDLKGHWFTMDIYIKDISEEKTERIVKFIEEVCAE